MVTEQELREVFLKKFLQLWREKSPLAKRGKPIERTTKVQTRAYGIRKHLPKVVTNQTVQDFLEAFLKKERDRGFIDTNAGDFYIRHIPYMELMLETIDPNGRSTGLLERPIVAIYAEAGFTPVIPRRLK